MRKVKNMNEHSTNNKYTRSNALRSVNPAIRNNADDVLDNLVGKDVYAVTSTEFPFYGLAEWDVREHNATNDASVTDYADIDGLTVIKVVEDGIPTCRHLDDNSIVSIPTTSGIQECNSDVLAQTYSMYQNSTNLVDLVFAGSVNELDEPHHELG